MSNIAGEPAAERTVWRDRVSHGLSHTRAIGAMLTGFALCELLIWPVADVPLIDDWTYAWSVSHLLETGRLEILSISAVYPVTQILWGALFSLPFGFSFAALRMSSVVLAALGSCALYLMLCELGCARGRALLGALCVACNPVSVLLAHSFMTDVPLVALSSCAAAAYVRGFSRRQARWLWLALPLSVAAVLVRQVAIVVPLAAAVTCSFTRDRALRRIAAGPALAACAAALIAWGGIGSLVGPAAMQDERLNRLQYISQVGLVRYARLSVQMLLVLALMLLPISLASLRGRSWQQLTAAGVSILAGWPILSSPSAWSPLAPEHATLSVYELGSVRNLIAGELSLPAHLGWLPPAARVLMLCSLGALLAAARGASRELTRRPAARFCVLTAVLHFLLVSALWLYADRYYLALLPALVACVLPALQEAPLSRGIASAAIAAQLTIGIAGTRDALRYNQICGSTYATLVEAGIRPYDIDAGWSWNGWVLYAQENLPEGIDRERDIAAVTSKMPRPFMFAKAPVAGYRPLLHLRWRGWAWPWPNELFVLARDGTPLTAQQ